MTLDLSRITREVEQLADGMERQGGSAAGEALARAFLEVIDDDLRARMASARTSWLLARPDGSFRSVAAAGSPDGDFAVVASDGSFILPDRHSPARFYLINVGKVLLRYGSAPSAELTADPTLYFREEELYVPNDVRRIPVNGAVLGLKRSTEELRAVAERAAGLSCPTLALQDGTLILWALESQPDFVIDWVLEPFLATMRGLQEAQVPVAGFISAPGSRDVLNTLRVSVCDYPPLGRPVNCDDCRGRIATEGREPPCDALPDVTDRYLFEQVARLRPGERSQTFASTSKILERYGADFAVHYFYLHTGVEVARVEVPRWVAEDRGLLDWTQAVIYDQCQRGRGYPSALQEAHEMAVVKMDERRAVELLIEQALAKHGLLSGRSAKDGSKRGRFV
ncbi:MAG TPA: DNA double-strand break repair nuclease NurA [Thermomicrobiaceae bacterium]|nr:DNA double-strand break repair nuclease NurA [Thermomicrobiaceae bacterium]